MRPGERIAAALLALVALLMLAAFVVRRDGFAFVALLVGMLVVLLVVPVGIALADWGDAR